jgi:hypothetical protein
MDFSIVLNKKQVDETGYGEFLNKTNDLIVSHIAERNVWDISCIEKK